MTSEWKEPCKIAGLTFTDLCNQNCKHCHNDSRQRVAKPQLTMQEWEKVTSDLVELGVEFVSFGGGESLLHSEFLDFCSMLVDHGMRLGLITNGTASPQNIPWEIFETVSVSLEFADEEAQDRFRGYRGAHRAAIDTLEALKEYNVERELFTALMKTNREVLPSLLELAEEQEVDFWKVIRFRSQGRGDRLSGKLGLSATDYKTALTYMCESGYQLVVSDPIFATLGVAGYYKQGCTCGTSSIRIEADGSITPCTFMSSYILGDVRNDSLVEIWKSSERLEPFRRRHPPSECRGCSAWTHCRGGCLGSTYLSTGEVDRRDPQCWLMPSEYGDAQNPNAEREEGLADMRSFVCSAYLAINGDTTSYPITRGSNRVSA